MESTERHPVSVQTLLIRQIQMETGHAPCYATAQASRCDRLDCCWRSDCYYDGSDAAPAHRASTGFHHAGG